MDEAAASLSETSRGWRLFQYRGPEETLLAKVGPRQKGRRTGPEAVPTTVAFETRRGGRQIRGDFPASRFVSWRGFGPDLWSLQWYWSQHLFKKRWPGRYSDPATGLPNRLWVRGAKGQWRFRSVEYMFFFGVFLVHMSFTLWSLMPWCLNKFVLLYGSHMYSAPFYGGTLGVTSVKSYKWVSFSRPCLCTCKDMAAYTFHKFNAKWRNFDGPMPSEDDCQYLTLPMLQKFFNQAG